MHECEYGDVVPPMSTLGGFGHAVCCVRLNMFLPIPGSAWCQGMMNPQMGAGAVQHMDPTAAWYYHYSQSQFAATALNTAAFYITQASAHHGPLIA